MNIRIQRINKELPLPTFHYEGDAAFDLHSAEDKLLQPMEKAILKAGIKIAIPKHHVGLIWDRSGLAAKHSLHCLAGVIDSGYRGEISVILINLGKERFQIEKGMRIAQMLIQPVAMQAVLEEVDELDITERHDKAFGSSGYH